MFKKFSWGHGVVVALALFMGFILFMVFVFPNGKQNSEMVSDNYYEDELHFQKVIDSKKNAEQLEEKPVYSETNEGIKITFPNNIVPDGKKIDFSLFRTDDKNLDVNKTLNLSNNSDFIIPKEILVKGSYTLKVKWEIDKKGYQIDYDVLWK
ncbi:MAG: FixH family protein [Bacteroidetes bacterium]|jgi:hypothetical protein|nr:FixH family protein [Bacteroidota bacterium]